MENRPNLRKESQFKTQILVGDVAVHLLQDIEFQSKWMFLFENSLVKSIFQEKSFVLPWYRRNQNEFRAIVLTLYLGEDLVGVLMLAQKIERKGIVQSLRFEGAGTSHALYQTWLVLPEYNNNFWEIGIKNFFVKFPKAYINLKSVPGIELFDSLKRNKKFLKMTVLEKFYNPILDYKKEDFKEVLKKRHFKSKDNRLNRYGKVKFEKVKSVESLNEAFNEIEVFYDLRQGAAFNKIPLGKGSTLRQLFLDWFQEGILHVTILSLDGDLICAVIVINDRETTAHLAGLISFSPKQGKLSPGLVHLFNLAKLLHEEGFYNFKLSPGYDSYKERFSNSHEIIYELIISQNLPQLIKRKMRNKLRQTFLKMGKRPMEIEVSLSKSKATIKNRISYFFRRLIKGNRYPDEKLIAWAKKTIFLDISHLPGYRRNNLRDLLLATDADLCVSRWEFLEDALKRLEDHQSFLTKVKEEQLLACIWYKTNNNGEINFEENLKIYTSIDFLDERIN